MGKAVGIDLLRHVDEIVMFKPLVLLDHGHMVDEQIGALPERQLCSWLESELPTRAS